MQFDKELGSPLDLAVQAKESKLLEAMLNAGVNPNAVNSWGTPLIFTAATLDSSDNMKLLVAAGADINLKEENLGKTAIFDAISQRCYDNAIFLIERGAKVNLATKNGLTLAYSVQWDLDHHREGSRDFAKLLHLKRMMEERGIIFPVDPPKKDLERSKNLRQRITKDGSGQKTVE